MDSMEQTIKEKLREIEKAENVRIIYACESGSRAWGFASPDSDYDVRFVYVRPLEEYLRLDKTRDVIEYEQNEVYDINGWDVSKLLRLAAKSNPVIYEWADCPIVYRTSGDWERIKAALGGFYLLNKLLYHYSSMCVNNIRSYFHGDEVPLKKYLYILRPILACEWVMTKRCPPPTDFNKLREAVLSKELEPSVEKLLAAKTNSGEKQTGPHLEDIDRYVQDKINEVDLFLSDNDFQQGEADWTKLNALFLEILNKPKPTVLKNWMVEPLGMGYEIVHGTVYNHKRLFDGDFIHTSRIRSIRIDYENEAAMIQTLNTLYTCPLEDCYFFGQDKYPGAIPDYQKIRGKYGAEHVPIESEEGKIILAVSNIDDYYFHSLLGKINGEELEFKASPHLGMFTDSFLLQNHEHGIDIRYYVFDGLIEFYSIDTNGLALFVHNAGTKSLSVRYGDKEISLEPNERKGLNLDAMEVVKC